MKGPGPKPALSLSLELLTPESAKNYLAYQAPNRALREEVLAGMQADHMVGKFYVTGEPIIFNGDGRLIDGQHRCEMVVRTGIPLWVVAVRGVPKIAGAYINGKRHGRSLRDELSILVARPVTAPTAGVLHPLAALERGDFFIARKPEVRKRMTPPEVEEARRDLQLELDWLAKRPPPPKDSAWLTGPAGVRAAFAYVWARHPVKANELWERYLAGRDPERSPLIALRDYVKRQRGLGGSITLSRGLAFAALRSLALAMDAPLVWGNTRDRIDPGGRIKANPGPEGYEFFRVHKRVGK